tara:strand:- start:177 stop:848 length:672 start_codon:yes stop_codon:yes gene_type:complete
MSRRGKIGDYSRSKLENIIQDTATSGGITVEEVDGTPSVSSVETIKVSNGTLTDDGSGAVTISTTATVSTKRLIIAASACTAEARTQDITIYTKTADEGIANVRVRWGSSKLNYGGSAFYLAVGFHPTGGSLDNDSFLLARDIAGVSAGEFAIAEYFTQGGAVWGPNSYRHRYYMNTLAHYQTAGVITVSITLAVGEDVGDISSGTIEVFLDIANPGAGTTIS